MENELSTSQIKTAQSCFNMFKKWKTITESEKKTYAHYLKACTEGYPRGTKINPSLLKSRLRGIQNFSKIDPKKVTISEKELDVCHNIIKKYRDKLKEDDKN